MTTEFIRRQRKGRLFSSSLSFFSLESTKKIPLSPHGTGASVANTGGHAQIARNSTPWEGKKSKANVTNEINEEYELKIKRCEEKHATDKLLLEYTKKNEVGNTVKTETCFPPKNTLNS